MATTGIIGLLYPSESAVASINVAVAGLAGSVDAKVGPYVLDTGWVSIPLYAGFTGGSPRCRRIGMNVYFQASTVTGNFPVGGTDIGTLPAEFRPSATNRYAVYLSGGHSGLIGVGGNGIMTISNQTGATRTSLQVSCSWLFN